MGLVKEAPHSDVTWIIGACMAVHNDLGPGHREETYQNALAAKFREPQVAFEEQVPIEISEADGVPVALYVPDFIVDASVIVEIKAQSHQLTGDDMAQCIDYFAGSTSNVGLLVNFGRPRLNGNGYSRRKGSWITDEKSAARHCDRRHSGFGRQYPFIRSLSVDTR